MTPTRIVLLSDGRAGHFRLAEGVVAAIARERPVTVSRVAARRPRWFGRPVALMSNVRAPPALILRMVFGIDPKDVLPADLIVSAGAETLGANIALARLGAVPNIFYGSLRQFRAADITLALTSYHRPGMPPNQRVTLKPSAFDPAGPTSMPEVDTGHTDRRHLALILGGTAPDCVWSTSDWATLLELVEMGARAGQRWVIANSRRTPDTVGDRFRDAASRHPAHLSFVDVRLPGAPSLAGLLVAASAVIVTADSSSMVSEAVWARRPVIAVMPAGGVLTADEAAYRQWLADQRWIATVDTARLTLDVVDRVQTVLTPRTDNPQAALTELIRAHIPAIFEPDAPGMVASPAGVQG